MDGNVWFSPLSSCDHLFEQFQHRGFGSQMTNTPMVIMWVNNNQVVLSQRKAATEAMPTVDASPPRTATLATSLSVVSKSFFENSHLGNKCLLQLSTTKPELAYTIPVSLYSVPIYKTWL